jgi:hypothetical protein
MAVNSRPPAPRAIAINFTPNSAYGDGGGEREQHEGGASDPENRDRRKHARTFELSLMIVGMLPPIRIALRVCRLDQQCLLVSRAAPLAAVLQVTA